MGMEFGFGVLLLQHEDPTFLETKGENDLSIGYLGLNWSGVDAMNEITHGAFFELIGKSMVQNGQWYVLLEPNGKLLKHLREMLPSIPEGLDWQRELKKRLKCLLDNADSCLNLYGRRAIMLIY